MGFIEQGAGVLQAELPLGFQYMCQLHSRHVFSSQQDHTCEWTG